MTDHFLVVEADGPDETAWYIEHPPDCPQSVLFEGDGAGNDVWHHDCAYEWEVENAGEDAIEDGDLPTEVGRYPIEWWHEEHRGFDWVEHSTGIRIVDVVGGSDG